MVMQKGLITKIIQWGTHPYYSDGSVLDWAGGLVLLLIVSFLWATVVSRIE